MTAGDRFSQRPRPRVVTLGGGHGQAALLSALYELDTDVNAVVSVADDGGCSGVLRKATGGPPPGDMRRCLSALSTRSSLAKRFERRVLLSDGRQRSAGNLVLTLMRQQLGTMQAAVDWAADLLGTRGRVLPASEHPAELVVCDDAGHIVSGESRIARAADGPVVAGVHTSHPANPAAIAAIGGADVLLIGPGSFFTSTLAVVGTKGIGASLVESQARCCYLANLSEENNQTSGWSLERYVRVLRDHLTIASLGGEPRIDVLVHSDQTRKRALDDGTLVFESPIAQRGAKVHDPALLAVALSRLFEFERARPDAPVFGTSGATPTEALEEVFDEALARALETFGLVVQPEAR